MKKFVEVNFDGLVGPTHNYSGLARGNMRSLENRFRISHPRAAALQGLAKMKHVHALGVPQGFIPPQTRPDLDILRRRGYVGSDRDVLLQAASDDFDIFLTACSASSMWVANAATVTPSADAVDGQVHITAANLLAHAHRSYESQQTYEFLKNIFPRNGFAVHSPLDSPGELDEGAANHMRFCRNHAGPGVHVFVYGEDKEGGAGEFPVRQTLAASQAVALQHGLTAQQTVFLRQNPAVIAQGVFHNDVIAMSNEDVFIYHQDAYAGDGSTMAELQDKFYTLTGDPLKCIEIPRGQLSVADSVRSYLFNSQLITTSDGGMIMICPEEAQTEPTGGVIQGILQADNRIADVHFVPVRESMLNGGGPACLRLRVPLSMEEYHHVNAKYLLDDSKFKKLEDWVCRNYREELTIEDLRTFDLYAESKRALEELVTMINEDFTHE